MENKKDYTLNELKVMACDLGDCIMSDGYQMSINKLKEGLHVRFNDRNDSDEFEFILPYSREKVIVIEENMLPSYYERFLYERYDHIFCMTMGEFSCQVACIDSAMECLGIYNRNYLPGEESFFRIAKIVEDNKVENREFAVKYTQELSSANNLYRKALKDNCLVPITLDKYRESLFEKTRDLLYLIISRLDFYASMEQFKNCKTSATVRGVEINNEAYKAMLERHGLLGSQEDALRLNYYDNFREETEIKVDLYDGSSKVIHVAGDVEDNIACIRKFFSIVLDCRNNFGDSDLSERVAEVLKTNLDKANQELATNEYLTDLDLQESREIMYNQTLELIQDRKQISNYMWIKGQFIDCVNKIKGNKIQTLVKAEELKFKLVNVNESYASILCRQDNGYEDDLRYKEFVECLGILDSMIANFSKPKAEEEQDSKEIHVEEHFANLIKTEIEDLNKEDLECYEVELVTTYNKLRTLVKDKDELETRFIEYRDCMDRVADSFNAILYMHSCEDDEDIEELDESIIQELLGEVSDVLGVPVSSISVYYDGEQFCKSISSERELQSLIAKLIKIKAPLASILESGTLDLNDCEEISRINTLVEGMDIQEIRTICENATSQKARDLAKEVRILIKQIDDLMEAYRKKLVNLNIVRF